MPSDVIFEVKVVNEQIVTIPRIANEVQTEAIGDALKNAAQDGYSIASVSPIQREVGTQRDPETQTLGVKIKLVKT